MLRRVGRGGAAGAPWLIFKRAGWGGAHKLIGRLPKRPNAQVRPDIASAACQGLLVKGGPPQWTQTQLAVKDFGAALQNRQG